MVNLRFRIKRMYEDKLNHTAKRAKDGYSSIVIGEVFILIFSLKGSKISEFTINL